MNTFDNQPDNRHNNHEYIEHVFQKRMIELTRQGVRKGMLQRIPFLAMRNKKGA